MPKSSFTLDQVKKNGLDFPRLKLEQNETARVIIIEGAPTYAWTHRLQKPRFSPVTGAMLMKTVERRSGEKLEVADLEYVGGPVCFGNLDVLDEKGVDKDHCPVCSEAIKHPEWFSAPERRFAVHVLKYDTKPGSSQISLPFSVRTQIWVMSENRFAKVTGVINEWGGDPTAVDLVLGPCKNAGFQNYEVAAGQVCEMRVDADRMKRAAETFKENNAGDLEPYCGRVTQVSYLKTDIEDVINAWRKASQPGGAGPAPVDTTGTLDSSLLDEGPKSSAPAADLSSLDDTISAPAEEVAAPAAAPAAPKGEDVSFEELLKGLS